MRDPKSLGRPRSRLRGVVGAVPAARMRDGDGAPFEGPPGGAVPEGSGDAPSEENEDGVRVLQSDRERSLARRARVPATHAQVKPREATEVLSRREVGERGESRSRRSLGQWVQRHPRVGAVGVDLADDD